MLCLLQTTTAKPEEVTASAKKAKTRESPRRWERDKKP